MYILAAVKCDQHTSIHEYLKVQKIDQWSSKPSQLGEAIPITACMPTCMHVLMMPFLVILELQCINVPGSILSALQLATLICTYIIAACAVLNYL